MVASVRQGSTLLLGFSVCIALAISRSLHRRGVRVVVAILSPDENPLPSRTIARFYSVREFATEPAALAAELRRIIAAEHIDMVVPITDRALHHIAPLVRELRGEVIMACPDADVIACALDKEATAALADRVGVPTPRSVSWRADPAVSAAPPPLAFPLYAKSHTLGTQQTPLREPIDDIAALRALARGAASESRFVLQEFIPGDDVGVAALMSRGRRLAMFQYRILRCGPAHGGPPVMTRSEPLDAALADCTERILRALEWEGVAELDYRHDRRTGRFAFLEINARFWGSLSAAIAAGVDFPWALWQLLHGRVPPPQDSYRIGSLTQALNGEVDRLLGLARQPKAARRGHSVVGDALRVACMACRPDVNGMLWSWRDPQPAWQTATTLSRCWLLTRWRHLVGRRA
jgi:predicted ATP-grasp superfamily ATP-dependent carboligase